MELLLGLKCLGNIRNFCLISVLQIKTQIFPVQPEFIKAGYCLGKYAFGCVSINPPGKKKECN